MQKENKRSIGFHYEEIAAEFLLRQGIRILERNYYTKFGEIDLIGIQKGIYVFVEVKYRSPSYDGAALYAVNGKKQKTIRAVSEYYLLKKLNRCDVPCRFDVVAIQGNHLKWIPNAF